jgi:GT2 family glycosyltransferase
MGNISMVTAVVVTYNRKALLKQCLDGLQKQTRPLDRILIVDNNSSDGTAAFLTQYQGIDVLELLCNEGSSGGFYRGIKNAYEQGADWVWVMDDDVIAAPTALEELITFERDLGNVGFLCSRVVSPDNKPMNVPTVENRSFGCGYSDWAEYLSEGAVRVRKATFVSLFISREAINQCGFPIKEFFIWGDDTEYTERISKKFPCYLYADSVVTHLRNRSEPPSIVSETDLDRIKLHYYRQRNKGYIRKRNSSLLEYVKYVLSTIRVFPRLVTANSHRLQRLKTFYLGTLAGLLFSPNIEKPKDSSGKYK